MAVVTAYGVLDLVYPTVFYGSLQSYDAAHITISDGTNTGVYYGSFTYSIFGLSGRHHHRVRLVRQRRSHRDG